MFDDNKQYYNADVIILDIFGNHFPFKEKTDYFSTVASLLKDSDYGVAHNQNGIIVLKKEYSKHLNRETLSFVEKQN